MEQQQHQLWHDRFEDALIDVISALGGWSAVGPRLWSHLPASDAARKLQKCLTCGPDKLSLYELQLILTWGREAECHIGVAYVNRATGYAQPAPQDPEAELERDKREFVRSVAALERVAKRIADAEARRLSLVRSA